MNLFYKRFSNFSTYVIYAIFALMGILLLVDFLFEFSNEHYIFYIIGFLSMIFLGIFVFGRLTNYLEKKNEKWVIIGLLVACFLVKFLWIWFNRIPPMVDYARFYKTAVDLSESFVIDSRYVALFPHIFGYSSFLSVFMKVFGTSYMVAPVVNVVLSTIAMGCIYYICKKLAGVKTAIIGSLLWIVLPSQTIFNMYVLSEPLYTTVLLMSIALMIVIKDRLKNKNIITIVLYSLLLSILLVVVNMSRPIAAIPIIALAIWLYIIDTGHLKNKKLLLNKSVYFGVVIVSYFILSSLANQYVSLRLGEEIATTPGYNIYVGFNMENYGKWNQADSDLLFYYNDLEGWTANDVQKQMLEEAKERIFSGEINFPELFYKKFLSFLSGDGAAVGYASSVLDHPLRLIMISNTFYYFLIAFSLCGIVAAWRRKEKSILIIVTLFAIGLTMAQMLVEVASRYHYSITISFVILAAVGINSVLEKRQDLKGKSEMNGENPV